MACLMLCHPEHGRECEGQANSNASTCLVRACAIARPARVRVVSSGGRGTSLSFPSPWYTQLVGRGPPFGYARGARRFPP